MKKTEMCLISSNPNFDGGVTLFTKNLINYLQSSNKDINFTWIYLGREDKNYTEKGVNYIQIKTPNIFFLEDFSFNRKVKNILNNKKFDIINSHAIWGYWMKNYIKKERQSIIHTYHGSTYYFINSSRNRFGIIKRIILLPLLIPAYYLEKPPIKKADKIICVSEKVKRQFEILYKSKREMNVLRTGVDLNNFKIKNKDLIRKNLNLEKKKTYGLYVGRGGFWTKGLDRAISLSEEIYKRNKDYKLIVIGSDYKKVKHLLEKEFIIFLEKIPRDKIPDYYCASDLFFCLSRYEGGAPTLVVSEAMASGCFLVCSKDSNQEIIQDNENGLIIAGFKEKEAERILKTLKDRKLKENIIKNSINTIKKLSLEDWGSKYSKLIGF